MKLENIAFFNYKIEKKTSKQSETKQSKANHNKTINKKKKKKKEPKAKKTNSNFCDRKPIIQRFPNLYDSR